MSKEDRRAAIVNATLPLLRLYGTRVTTRQIAQAAGVAEGTIFRVFADKDELIRAALDAAFDPAPLENLTASFTAADPLEARVERIAAFLLEQNRSTVELMRAIHLAMKAKVAGPGGFAPHPHGRGGPAPPGRAELFQRSLAAITRALSLGDPPWAVPPGEAAEMLVAMSIAAGVSLPWTSRQGEITAGTICTILLHGALAGPVPSASTHPLQPTEND